MNIVVISGSARKSGTSNYLADRFIQGALDGGNSIFHFDATANDINPCIGCNNCRVNSKCIWDDSYNDLIEPLLKSELVVWVTPVYYMNMTSQLKKIIDRMYQLEPRDGFKGKKKYIIISTAWSNDKNVFNNLVNTIEGFCGFLKWEKCGEILVNGVDDLEDVMNTKWGEITYEFARRKTE